MSPIIMISAVVLSAGQGRRMSSSLPKSLHPVGGKPILARILQSLQEAGLGKDVRVITQMAENLVHPVVRAFQAHPISQKSKPGTAGALMHLPLEELAPYLLVINGDHPLIFPEDLKSFCDKALDSPSDISVGTCSISDPKQFGRVVRESGQIIQIVEHYDFTEEIESIREINTGLMLIRTEILKENLKLITDDNPKKEYPLTDLVSIAFRRGLRTAAIEVGIHTACGVNTQEDLSLANIFLFDRKNQQLMSQGVIFPNPQQVHVEEDVRVGPGSILYPGVYLKGKTSIGSFCAIEQNCFIFDSEIADSVHIKSSCYLEKAQVCSKSVVGPFAHLRPGSVIGEECKIGNFVEIKNTSLGSKSKASHMSYLGDSMIGRGVNIGCGAVTCNYAVDRKKYKTKIEDGAFIGGGSMLVAPVEVGEKSIVGAGSVITKNVPQETLVVARAQETYKKRK